MQATSINLSQKALPQIENRIDKSSVPQPAMVYGILRDKERLDAGGAHRDHRELHAASGCGDESVRRCLGADAASEGE